MYQNGGCDYTVACGTKCVKLQSETEAEALDEAENCHFVREHTKDGDGSNYCHTMKLLHVVGESDVIRGLDGRTDEEAAECERIAELNDEISTLKKRLDEARQEANFNKDVVTGIFGQEIFERADKADGLRRDFRHLGTQVNTTARDVALKAMDMRAQQLVEPKMSAKKKMATDFLERLSSAGSPQESAEIMQDVSNVLRRIAK
jgi:hypothetical protein